MRCLVLILMWLRHFDYGGTILIADSELILEVEEGLDLWRSRRLALKVLLGIQHSLLRP